MITIETVGVAEVSARLDRFEEKLMGELYRAIKKLSLGLRDDVVQNYLQGQTLGVRTGRGQRSIHEDTTVTGNTVTGIVSTNVFYMIGWETGWQNYSPRARLTAAKGKFELTGSADTFKNGSPKKRAFLIPAFQKLLQSGLIEIEINAAIERASR